MVRDAEKTGPRERAGLASGPPRLCLAAFGGAASREGGEMEPIASILTELAPGVAQPWPTGANNVTG